MRSEETFELGSGLGWHVQASFLCGYDAIEFKGGLTISRSRLVSAYARSYSYMGLGGSTSDNWTGKFDDNFTNIEMPLLLSLSVDPVVRFELGCAPWTLIAIDHRDQGTKTSHWWTNGQLAGNSTTSYDERSRDIKAYSRYGLSGVLGVSCTVKKHFVASLSGIIGFVPDYQDGRPYAGHQSAIRMSLGYIFEPWE